jgi:hypothetical protein
MKQVLFILLTSYFILLPEALARAPIIINQALPSYPTQSGQDQDYLPSDPHTVKTIPHTRTTQINQTFNPIKIGTDDQGQPIYQFQTIDKIQENIDLSHYTNSGFSSFADHISHRLSDPYAASQRLELAFKSYRINSPLGSSNLARRSLSAASLACLKGQRLISAIRTLNSSQPLKGTTVDIELTRIPRLVRITELAYALRHEPIFSPPGQPCNSTVVLAPLGGLDLSLVKQKYASLKLLDSAIYQSLYQNALEPVDDNSLGAIEEQCDLTDAGQAVNCKSELRAYPQGSGPAGNGQKVMSYLLSASVQPISKDYGHTANGSPIPDQPNPISFLAQFFKLFFSGELKQSLTYSGPTQLTTYVDARVENGLRTDETALLHLFPQKDIDSQGLNSFPGSSTNQGLTLDPAHANARLRQQLNYSLTPQSWQY